MNDEVLILNDDGEYEFEQVEWSDFHVNDKDNKPVADVIITNTHPVGKSHHPMAANVEHGETIFTLEFDKPISNGHVSGKSALSFETWLNGMLSVQHSINNLNNQNRKRKIKANLPKKSPSQRKAK